MRYKEPVLLLGLTVLLLLPFLNRPLFVDDHAHIQVALDLVKHPLTPFMTDGSGMGWQKGQDPLNANPLLFFYIMGYFMTWFGSALWKSHLFMVPFHCLAVLSLYGIAKRYLRYPFWASALWLVSPHFWLTANSLLLDGMIAPFMLAGIYLWIKGWDQKRFVWMIPAGLFLGLASLIKYTAVLGWGVVALWTILEGKDKKNWRWAGLLIPGALFGAWLVWTRHLYHTSHFQAVAQASMVAPSFIRFYILFVFTSGTTPFLLIALLFMFVPPWSEKRAVPLTILIGNLLIGPLMGVNTVWGLQMGFWAGIFLVWAVTVLPQKGELTPSWLFFLIWVGLGLLELVLARDWMCGRYFVIVGPALVLLTVLIMEKRIPHILQIHWFRPSVWSAFFLLSGLLAWADQEQAKVDTQVTRDVSTWRETHPQTGRFHYPDSILSGLSSYLPAEKWHPVSPGQQVKKGDWALLPLRSLSPKFFPLLRKPKPVVQFVYPITIPLRTLDILTGAGFYGSIWGPLPFSFSTAPAEIYILVQELGDELNYRDLQRSSR